MFPTKLSFFICDCAETTNVNGDRIDNPISTKERNDFHGEFLAIAMNISRRPFHVYLHGLTDIDENSSFFSLIFISLSFYFSELDGSTQSLANDAGKKKRKFINLSEISFHFFWRVFAVTGICFEIFCLNIVFS